MSALGDAAIYLTQISDSSFPSGAIAVSQGLEASHFFRFVTDEQSLFSFIKMSIETAQKLVLPVCIEALRITEDTVDTSAWIRRICALDANYHINVNNSITRRASLNQAKCFLRAAEEAFARKIFERGSNVTMKLDIMKHILGNNLYDECGNAYPFYGTDVELSSGDKSSAIAINSACKGLVLQGHFAVIFGIITGLMGLSAKEPDLLNSVRFTFLRCVVRDILSCATRLNIIGTYDAAAMQFDCCRIISKCVLSTDNNSHFLPTNEEVDKVDEKEGVVIRVVTTCPILEILQGKHDVMYTRLFTS